MLKDKIIDLIYKFDRETWKYIDNDQLDDDMKYIFAIEKEIQDINDITLLKSIYEKLLSMVGIIRFKYGFESMIISSNPELEPIKKIVDDISISGVDIINQYNNVSSLYFNYIKSIKNVDFIKNNYENIENKEGLYLAIESLKSLISNEKYKQLFDINKINEILIDCIKLNNNIESLEDIELKYKEIIQLIWKQSLSNTVDENGNFMMLYSNIATGYFKEQAENLVDRPFQASCSLISSDFIATYGDNTRRIGFIYPNDSIIIAASAYDLGSNVFGEGLVNKEKGTTIVTPKALERIGIERAMKKGEDKYSSSCFSEVLVNSKPCGIVILGLGEKNINIDYYDAKMFALEKNLPICYIDLMQYKDNLSENDKNYIAFHSLASYLGLTREELADFPKMDEYINKYKEQLTRIFLTLKSEGKLDKNNMCQAMSDIVDFPNNNVKTGFNL